MIAVILAAGEGSRLKPFTITRPKVMIPVGNKPILEYVIAALRESGIIDIIIVVGYKREKIMDYFGDGHAWGVNITYVEQSPQLGTAHALRQAADQITDHFLLVNGDTVVNASDIKQIMNAEICDAAMLTIHASPAKKYGVVETNNGLVKNILEKPKCEDDGNIINAGVYRFSIKIFDFLRFMEISERGEYEITDAIKKMISNEYTVRSINSKAIWMDALYPWDLLKLNSATLKHQAFEVSGIIEKGALISGHVGIGNNTVIRSGTYILGPVCIGDNCDIGPNSVILPDTSIGSNCTIEPLTRISNSIIMNNVKVASLSHISGSIVGEGTTLGTGFIAEEGDAMVEVDGTLKEASIGAIIGDNTDIAGRVLSKPGNIIGIRCKVGSGIVVRSNISDHTVVV
jgi:UDP-N-acetylglucosamine diphosphorylase/glucosamine-1-phosphate N-acetyltransferase